MTNKEFSGVAVHELMERVSPEGLSPGELFCTLRVGTGECFYDFEKLNPAREMFEALWAHQHGVFSNALTYT